VIRIEGKRRTRVASPGRLASTVLNGLALLLILLASGCAVRIPDLGRNLPSDFADANHAFDARIQDRFPIGSSEAALLTELEQEGFVVSDSTVDPATYKSVAIYDRPGLPCRLTWRVFWSSEDSKISAISGHYGGVCL
jgi:hypothetical protein